MKNREISEIFEKIGDILEFKGDSSFRVNAYRKVARVLQDLTEDIEVIHQEGRLRSIPGVGWGIAKKIAEYLDTGKMTKYEKVRKGVPDELIRLLGIPGMGPKTVALVYQKLGIEDIESLEKTVQEGRLRDLPGLGARKEENILRGIKLMREAGKRISLGVALPLVERIVDDLKRRAKVSQVYPAGSLRRMKETVGDIDILATGTDGGRIIAAFTSGPGVRDLLASGETKGSIIAEAGIQVDLRVVPQASYGSALQYFTGSKAHNIHLREIAKSRGMKISEYGIFRGEERLGGEREEDIYSTLGLSFIPPELREDRGEIEAAQEGKIPGLVEDGQIKGDLHVHSKWSDGTASIEGIALKAREMGYEYIAICDHSQSLKFAGGVSVEDMYRKLEEIERLNRKVEGIRILSGTEVDIKTDGSLDYPDELLERLDLVVAAIHTGFKQPEELITRRMVSGLENPNVDIIAHPTGRLISSREGYSVDLGKVFSVAAEMGVALEINAYYDRLDLNDITCRRAKEQGIKLSIGTDAHHIDQLWMMRLGIAVAKRGWLGPDQLLNTWPLERLLAWLKTRGG